MLRDLRTVLWKEWREMVYRRGSVKGNVTSVGIFVTVFGVLLPLQSGPRWVDSPTVLLYWVWVPLFLVSTVVADSFAGERERHTLDTLLASRLSDDSILFGKACAAIGYGWGLSMASLATGIVTINVASEGFLMFSPVMGGSIFLLSLLSAGLAASWGTLISLRSSTVQGAQLTLSVGILLLIFIPIIGFQAAPENWRIALARMFAEAGLLKTCAVFGLLLILLNFGFLTGARTRFKRTQLILDS